MHILCLAAPIIVKLKMNVNARTNTDNGFTAWRLVEGNNGPNDECAELLRQVGGASFAFGDDTEAEIGEWFD